MRRRSLPLFILLGLSGCSLTIGGPVRAVSPSRSELILDTSSDDPGDQRGRAMVAEVLQVPIPPPPEGPQQYKPCIGIGHPQGTVVLRVSAASRVLQNWSCARSKLVLREGKPSKYGMAGFVPVVGLLVDMLPTVERQCVESGPTSYSALGWVSGEICDGGSCRAGVLLRVMSLAGPARATEEEARGDDAALLAQLAPMLKEELERQIEVSGSIERAEGRRADFTGAGEVGETVFVGPEEARAQAVVVAPGKLELANHAALELAPGQRVVRSSSNWELRFEPFGGVWSGSGLRGILGVRVQSSQRWRGPLLSGSGWLSPDPALPLAAFQLSAGYSVEPLPEWLALSVRAGGGVLSNGLRGVFLGSAEAAARANVLGPWMYFELSAGASLHQAYEALPPLAFLSTLSLGLDLR